MLLFRNPSSRFLTLEGFFIVVAHVNCCYYKREKSISNTVLKEIIMGFQHCSNCKKDITFKTRFKSVFFGYRPIICEECGVEHEVDERYRFVYSLYTVLIPILLVYFSSSVFGITSRFIQVLLVLVFGTFGVMYATSKVKYHKSKHQPIKEGQAKNKSVKKS